MATKIPTSYDAACACAAQRDTELASRELAVDDSVGAIVVRALRVAAQATGDDASLDVRVGPTTKTKK